MATILIDGKPIEETVWQVDGKTIPGSKAFTTLAMGSPLFIPVALGAFFLGRWSKKKKKG